jgi:hypothetical protein
LITIAGNGTFFSVQPGGSATFISGQKITILPDMTALAGGYMHAYIAPGGPYCANPSMVTLTSDDAPFQTGSEQSAFRIFPNPTTGCFKIDMPGCSSCEKLPVALFGMRGEEVFSGDLSGEGSCLCPLTGYPDGVYVLKVFAGDQTTIKKIIKN